MNGQRYVAGPIEVLQELYPAYSRADVIKIGDESVYEFSPEETVVDDPRTRILTQDEVLAATDVKASQDGAQTTPDNAGGAVAEIPPDEPSQAPTSDPGASSSKGQESAQ